MLRKGMFLADRYEIIDQIGTGGMSDVYKAKCHKLNRFVAIKVLKSEFSQDKNFVSKFRIEAQSAAGLTHPNIVSVYDVGDEDGIHYIVMELVEGITLKKYIEKKGKLSSKEAVSIAIQVAQGMEAAHTHHIVHRDIKPQNIIISKEGKVKVTDFGIARAATSQTINSSAMGSVHYISPEQARGGYSDEKSDIYSFGITLYEMLTGTVPFDGDSTVAVAVQHIQDEIDPVSKLVADIPVSVDKIVMKCTQKKTDRRYQSASELIADLKKSLVMPDVDFVKLAPAYASSSPMTGKAVRMEEPAEELDILEEEELEEVTDSFRVPIDEDDDDEDDDFFDDEEEEDDDEEEEYRKPVRKKSKKYNDDEDDEEDNGTLDNVMKWLGIGIAAIIIIITIVVVMNLAGQIGGGDVPEQTLAVETTTEDESNKVEVPAVTGLTEDAAKKALNAVGLGCKTTRQTSDTVAEGYVITQSVAAKSRVAKNTQVTVVISSGSTGVAIPNVVGRAEADAIAAITGAGLKSPIVDYAYNDTIEMGNVISQSPSFGNTVGLKDSITIVVSRGAETKMVTVPNLVNKTESQARQELDTLGLSVSISATQIMSATIPAGSVASQNYSAGREVAAGTTIELTLSIGLGVTTPTTAAGITTPTNAAATTAAAAQVN